MAEVFYRTPNDSECLWFSVCRKQSMSGSIFTGAFRNWPETWFTQFCNRTPLVTKLQCHSAFCISWFCVPPRETSLSGPVTGFMYLSLRKSCDGYFASLRTPDVYMTTELTLFFYDWIKKVLAPICVSPNILVVYNLPLCSCILIHWQPAMTLEYNFTLQIHGEHP